MMVWLSKSKSKPTKRALDGWHAPRVFWAFSDLAEVPVSEPVSRQPPVTQAVAG